MMRGTILTIVSAGALGALLFQSAGQGVPPQPAQPVQTAQSEQTAEASRLEEEARIAIQQRERERERDSKPTIAVSKRPGTKGNRQVRTIQEVSADFAFSSEAFREQPLMIRSSRADVKAMEQLSEDLSVMTRLLDKAVAEQTDAFHPATASGIQIVALGMQNSGRAMYVDDYGVIFTLRVNMPFKAEPKEVEVIQKEPTRRGTWEETRNELFGQRKRVKRWQPSAWRQFDQEEVDAFKTTLIDTLRSATNIRHLKPTDMITVVVRGTPQGEKREMKLKLESDTSGENTVIEEAANPDSTLVLRIQKMELDRSVSGRDSGELRKNVRISIY